MPLGSRPPTKGFTYPACHGIWRHWAPPLERSRLATLAFCGSYAGIVIGMPLCGLLTSAISWRASFYAYGILGVIWFVIWLWMAFERPSKHPFISLSELKYIEDSLGSTTQQSVPTIATTPWSSFLTSMPVYAIIVANFCRSWNFYMLVLFQASFLQERYNLEIAETGFLGSLPHLVMTIIVPSGGHLADTLRKRGIMSTTMVRKLFNCGGFGMEGFFFLIVAYSTTAKGATWALTFGVAFSGFAISGESSLQEEAVASQGRRQPGVRRSEAGWDGAVVAAAQGPPERRAVLQLDDGHVVVQ
ncbi:hypothetical protein FOCC_FOCC014605 [Frankliniella occidentalis]|nr:hypothetical protein FOCC_FOCC014605 [Frankliniella occidentalis]